jgi:glycosyltransferase involved in cell wall biosynthesis
MLDSLQRPGGGERLAVEGALRLDPERYERWFCLTRWQDTFEREEPARTILATLRESGVEIVKLRRTHRAALWSWLPLLRLLRGRRIDILHAHLFGSNVWASVLGPLARVPAVIAHEHMWAYSEGGMRPFIDREVIARFADAFIAVSHEGRRRMIEIERIPEDSVVYIPNGVAKLPAGDGAAIRTELGIPADAPLIGSVGHLRSEKAFEVLIEATARLRERSPDANVLIAGEGPEREMLEGLRSRLGLDGAVHLPGARSDIPDVLAALDVAVCCSDFEGGPLSVMEYMGAGLPVVATRVGGLPELVQDGETGILVEPRDPAALADAIRGLLADPDRRHELGSAGRDLRDREYDVGVWMRRIEALYALLLDARR